VRSTGGIREHGSSYTVLVNPHVVHTVEHRRRTAHAMPGPNFDLMFTQKTVEASVSIVYPELDLFLNLWAISTSACCSVHT
jgi:hypothetical protein